LVADVTKWGKSTGVLTAGDRVVFVTGTGLLNQTHNLIFVNEVTKNEVPKNDVPKNDVPKNEHTRQ
jgi:hypothetical protein